MYSGLSNSFMGCTDSGVAIHTWNEHVLLSVNLHSHPRLFCNYQAVHAELNFLLANSDHMVSDIPSQDRFD
jgi:hypothetical protein